VKQLRWFILMGLIIVMNVNVVKGEVNVIDDGKKVKFDYTLKVAGKVFDASEGKAPLEYTHGQGMIIKGLESALTGLKTGEETDVVVEPDDGYGPIDPGAIIEMPRTGLDPAIEPKVGMVLQINGKDGQAIPGVVDKVNEETLTLNFNHPLAGKELQFNVKIVAVE